MIPLQTTCQAPLNYRTPTSSTSIPRPRSASQCPARDDNCKLQRVFSSTSLAQNEGKGHADDHPMQSRSVQAPKRKLSYPASAQGLICSTSSPIQVAAPYHTPSESLSAAASWLPSSSSTTSLQNSEQILPEPLLFQIADYLLVKPEGINELTNLFIFSVNRTLRHSSAHLQNLIQRFLTEKPNRINSILMLVDGNISSLPPIWIQAIQNIGLHVKKINCTQCSLTTDSTRAIATYFTNLQGLQLVRCRLDDASLLLMGRLLQRSLTHLSFTACTGFTNQGIGHLRSLAKLQSLAFIFCEIGLNDRAAQYIAQIRSLQTLNLEGSRQITDHGLYHLATLPALTDLNLGSCILITDRGLTYLTLSCDLQSLNLTFCKNVFKGDPSYLQRFHNLNSIVLRRLPTFNKVLLQCFALMRGLRSVDLNGCSLNADVRDEIEALTERMSQLSISYRR